MNYQLLGRSRLRVSELCLGTMTFGEDWGWGANKEESRKMFDAFVKAGGNFIDTADGYTSGTSEKMVGEFVASDRERFVVATKYSFNSKPGDPNAGGNHRKHMVEALNGSLKRLGTDYVDLYWVHAWDELTPVEEVMVTAWSPLASGLLTGKYLQKGSEERRLDKAPSFEQMSHRNLAIAKLVVQIGHEVGKSPAQVALNWLRSKGTIIPILGARNAAQFDDNMGCVAWSLNEQQRDRLEEVSRIELGFPTDFLRRKEVRDFLHGGLFERVRSR